MKQRKEAVYSNREGNVYPKLRKMTVPALKYSNDNEYADSGTQELFRFFAETAVSLPDHRTGRPELHRDQAGRVAEHSACLVELSTNNREKIMERTEYGKST